MGKTNNKKEYFIFILFEFIELKRGSIKVRFPGCYGQVKGFYASISSSKVVLIALDIMVIKGTGRVGIKTF